jgi:hypothetical protein
MSYSKEKQQSPSKNCKTEKISFSKKITNIFKFKGDEKSDQQDKSQLLKPQKTQSKDQLNKMKTTARRGSVSKKDKELKDLRRQTEPASPFPKTMKQIRREQIQENHAF